MVLCIQVREVGLPGPMDPALIPVGTGPEQAPETAPLLTLNAVLVTPPPLKHVGQTIVLVSIASQLVEACMTLRSTCLAVATIDAENHLTSGHASSKGAIAGSKKWKTLINIFVVLGNCLSRSLSSTDAKKHKVARTMSTYYVSFKFHLSVFQVTFGFATAAA